MNTSTSKIVTASAGSGKTHTLTTKLIELLLDKVKSENIIAQTFTKKAAGEIYARVITRLIGLSSTPPFDPSIKRTLPDGLALRTLRDLIAKQDRLRIETLDSFFADLCKSHFIELSLMPNWQIADEKQVEKNTIDALKASIAKIGPDTFRLLLDFLFSNKTPNRVLEPILKELRDFKSILTFSDRNVWGNLPLVKATHSIEQVEVELKQLLEQSEQIDFHQGVWKSIRSILKAVEEKNYIYLCKSEFIGKILDGNLSYYNKTLPDAIVSSVVALSGAVQNEVIQQTNSRTLSLLGILTAYQTEYQQLIKDSGKLSFDDIAELTNSKVTELDSSDMFSRLSMSLEHLLLDEFQDTSPIQWNILENISKHILESSSTENSLFIVGDAKQAIYSWRGGSAEVFNHLRTIAPHIPEESLETNYRSHPGVIEFVNTVFSGLSENEHLLRFKEPIDSWLEEFKPHIANKKNNEHIVHASAYPEIPEDYHKYEHVINDIMGVQSTEPNASIAVLLRTNSQLEEFCHYLKLCGLEFTSSQTSKLDSYYPIQLLISLVTLAEHPKDKLSLVHLLESNLDLGQLIGSDTKEPVIISKLIKEKFLKEGFAITLSHFISKYLRTCSSESERNIIYIAISIALEFERKGLTNWSEWIERVSSTKIPASSESSLQIMSIHKAKGLEFDYVFIPELDDPLWRVANLKLLKKEENAFQAPTSIVRKPSEPEVNFVPALRELRDTWIDSQIREGLSLLYVAITRAIKGLFLYIDPNDKAVSEINILSLADVLRASLFYADQVAPEDDLYQSYRKPSENDAKNEEVNSSATEMLELKWSSVNPPLECSLKEIFKTSAKTSSSKSTHSLEIPELLSQLQGSTALNFGTLVHKCLEQINWLESETNIDSYLPDIVNSLGNPLESSLQKDILSYLKKSFSFPNIRDIFTKSAFSASNKNPIVLNEIALLNTDEGNLLAGNIDRLLIIEENDLPIEIIIYDFKTDSEIIPDRHKEQLRNYRQLVKAHWGLKEAEVRAFIVYLDNGSILEA